MFGSQDPPVFILSSVWHHHYGTITNIDAESISEKFNMNSADEISFDVYKNVDGKDCELWNKLISFRYIYVPSHEAYYKIDVSLDEDNKTIKHVVGTSAGEYELSNRIIRDMDINQATDIDYRNPNVSPSDVEPVLFYNPDLDKRDHSLLHLALKDRAMDWAIGHVDETLWNVRKYYTVSNQTVYDFLTNTVANEVQCLFLFDSVNRVINVYDLLTYCSECGHRGDFIKTCPKCGCTDTTKFVYGYGKNTHIYISPDNFAENISVDGDEGSVKNCFRLSGGDDEMTAALRSCNPAGNAYIYQFSDDDYDDMPPALSDALHEYNELYESKQPETSEWVTNLYNAWAYYYYYKDEMMPRGGDQIVRWEKVDEHGNPKVYEVNDLVYVPTLPAYYNLVCTQAGTVGDTEPVATGVILGDTIQDGTVVWTVQELTVAQVPNIEDQMGILLDALDSSENKLYYEKDDTPISDKSVDRLVKDYAAVFINPYYKVDVVVSGNHVTPNNPGSINPRPSTIQWTGKFKLIDTTNKDNTLESATKTYTLYIANNAAEALKYTQELTKRRLDKADTTFTELFDIDIPDPYSKAADTQFKAVVAQYSLNLLDGFAKSYEACLDVLSSNGVKVDDNFHGADRYTKFYVPYCGRRDIIDEEIVKREQQVLEYYNDPEDPNYKGGEEGLIQKCQKKLDEIADEVNLANFLKQYEEDHQIEMDLYSVFWHYLREGEYQNSNYISTGLSNNELVRRASELYEEANKELAKAKELKLTLSTTLKNLLNTKEFENFKDKFEIGDYIMCRADDVLYKMRLTEVEVNNNDKTSINVTFSNLTKSKTFMSDVQDILSQAHSIASSYTATTRQVEQNVATTKTVDSWTSDGLSSALVEISNNNNEEVTYDKNGIIVRQYNPVEDDYDPKQLQITHSMIGFTDDNWTTVSAALGLQKYHKYDNTTHQVVESQDYGYGLNAKFVESGHVYGSEIIGGTIYSDNYVDEAYGAQGSMIDLQEGDFSLAGGKLKGWYDTSANIYKLSVDIGATEAKFGVWEIDNNGCFVSGSSELAPDYISLYGVSNQGFDMPARLSLNQGTSQADSEIYVDGTPIKSTLLSVQSDVQGKQDTLTAGTNITIASDNTISATDTTYDVFTGATASTDGTSGLVPAPVIGDEIKYLKGDGTWTEMTDIVLSSDTWDGTNRSLRSAVTSILNRLSALEN
jgi:hypothetical protein